MHEVKLINEDGFEELGDKDKQYLKLIQEKYDNLFRKNTLLHVNQLLETLKIDESHKSTLFQDEFIRYLKEDDRYNQSWLILVALKIDESRKATLSQEQFISYLKEDDRYNQSWLMYFQQNCGITSIAHNPLLLKWLREYFSKQSSLPLVKAIYDWIFECWFNYQFDRLKTSGLIKGNQKDFIEHCWIYTHAVALKLREACVNHIDFTNESGFFLQWQRFFNSDLNTYLIAFCCPWQFIEQQQLSLYHSEIVDYFASLTRYNLIDYLHLPFIHGDEGIEELSRILNDRVLQSNDTQLIHLVADVLSNDIPKDNLFRLIYLSAHNKKFACIAANAITILNFARVSFSDMDLSNINIPNADLSNAILDSTNLKGACLDNVNLQGAWLYQANLSNTTMRGVEFDQIPYICCPYNVDVFAISNDKLWLASLDKEKNIICLWKIKDIQNTNLELILLKDNKGAEITGIAFTANSKFLAVSRKINIQFFNILSGKIESEINLHENEIMCIAINMENQLAIGSKNNIIYVWQVNDGHLKLTLEGHTDAVSCIVYSENGDLLVSGGSDGTICLWQTNEYKLLHVISEHLNEVNCVAISSNNYLVASGYVDGQINLWHVTTGKLLLQFVGHISQINNLIFRDDNELLASASSDMTVRLWEISSGNLLRTFVGHTGSVESIFFSVDNKFIISGGSDRTIRLWQLDQYESLHKSKWLTKKIYSIFIKPESQLIASGYEDGTIKLWQASNVTMIQEFQGHSSKVFSIAISPDSRLIASGDECGIIKLWTIVNKMMINEFEAYNCSVNSIAISPDNRLIASGSKDRKIKLWQIPDGKILAIVFIENNIQLDSLTFISNNLLLGFSTDNNTFWLLDVTTLKLLNINVSNDITHKIAKNAWRIQMETNIIRIYMQWGASKFLFAQNANFENVHGLSIFNAELLKQKGATVRVATLIHTNDLTNSNKLIRSVKNNYSNGFFYNKENIKLCVENLIFSVYAAQAISKKLVSNEKALTQNVQGHGDRITDDVRELVKKPADLSALALGLARATDELLAEPKSEDMVKTGFDKTSKVLEKTVAATHAQQRVILAADPSRNIENEITWAGVPFTVFGSRDRENMLKKLEENEKKGESSKAQDAKQTESRPKSPPK